MRVMTLAAAIGTVAALLSATSEAAYSQSAYSRCVRAASNQGLNPNSKNGRNFVNRCMARRQAPPRPSNNCPDDPRARSAFPSWACP